MMTTSLLPRPWRATRRMLSSVRVRALLRAARQYAPLISSVAMCSALTMVQCRSRHVKCDERRPTCSMCAEFGLPCAGYNKRIFFDSRNPENKIRFRRPLFNEAERERISQWLVSTAPPKSTLRMLSQIDEEAENASGSESVQLTLGPFGVFRLHQPSSPQLPAACNLNLIADVSENSGSGRPSKLVTPMTEPLPVDPSPSQSFPGLVQSLLEPLDADQSSSVDFHDWIIDPGRMEAMPPWYTPPDYQRPRFFLTHITGAPSLLSPSPQRQVRLRPSHKTPCSSSNTTHLWSSAS